MVVRNGASAVFHRTDDKLQTLFISYMTIAENYSLHLLRLHLRTAFIAWEVARGRRGPATGLTAPALYTLCVSLLYAQRIQCGCRVVLLCAPPCTACKLSVVIHPHTPWCPYVHSRFVSAAPAGRYPGDREPDCRCCLAGVPAMFVTVWATVRALLADTEWVTRKASRLSHLCRQWM